MALRKVLKRTAVPLAFLLVMALLAAACAPVAPAGSGAGI